MYNLIISHNGLRNFSFSILNFPLLDGDVHLAQSYGVYILQFVHYARVCCKLVDYNAPYLIYVPLVMHY